MINTKKALFAVAACIASIAASVNGLPTNPGYYTGDYFADSYEIGGYRSRYGGEAPTRRRTPHRSRYHAPAPSYGARALDIAQESRTDKENYSGNKRHRQYNADEYAYESDDSSDSADGDNEGDPPAAKKPKPSSTQKKSSAEPKQADDTYAFEDDSADADPSGSKKSEKKGAEDSSDGDTGPTGPDGKKVEGDEMDVDVTPVDENEPTGSKKAPESNAKSAAKKPTPKDQAQAILQNPDAFNTKDDAKTNEKPAETSQSKTDGTATKAKAKDESSGAKNEATTSDTAADGAADGKKAAAGTTSDDKATKTAPAASADGKSADPAAAEDVDPKKDALALVEKYCPKLKNGPFGAMKLIVSGKLAEVCPAGSKALQELFGSKSASTTAASA